MNGVISPSITAATLPDSVSVRARVSGGARVSADLALSRIYETEGVYLGEGGLSVEEVRDNWAKIADPSGQQAYVTGGEQSGKFFRKLQGG